MATPTHKEMLVNGCTTWKYAHKDISYVLSFHGYYESDDSYMANPGIWCYYITINEKEYPHRWEDFECGVVDMSQDNRPFFTEKPGKAFDDVFTENEITYSHNEHVFDHTTGKQLKYVKVGCDYAHLWHKERGYIDTLGSVKRDAIETVERFLVKNPDRFIRCGFSGIYDTKENFYRAINGKLIHNSKKSQIPDGWTTWMEKQ